MFDGNFNSETNGENLYYNSIKEKCNVIFDVGAHNNSIYVNDSKEVHYFEPLSRLLEELKLLPNKNTKAYFNAFGLSDKEQILKYYDNTGSFIDRTNGFSKTYSSYNGIDLLVKRGRDYIKENNVTNIDFLKIDVEGFELNVFKGFGEELKIVKYLQFEYGSAVADGGYRLIDMIEFLKKFNFDEFSYISNNGLVPITDYTDHWHYCNIVCVNKNH